MIRLVAVRSLLMICGGFVALLTLTSVLAGLPGFNRDANPNIRIVPVMDARHHYLVPSMQP